MGVEITKQTGDPVCATRDGIDTIRWVPTDGMFCGRQYGKGVLRNSALTYYRNADANSSVLAGFLAIDAMGANGHPVDVATGGKVPINFGVNKTAIYPTTGRLALTTDIGKTYDIYNDGIANQYLNLLAQSKNPLIVTGVIGDGSFVSVKIADGRRFGSLA